jgi:hypothetical protein
MRGTLNRIPVWLGWLIEEPLLFVALASVERLLGLPLLPLAKRKLRKLASL